MIVVELLVRESGLVHGELRVQSLESRVGDCFEWHTLGEPVHSYGDGAAGKWQWRKGLELWVSP